MDIKPPPHNDLNGRSMLSSIEGMSKRKRLPIPIEWWYRITSGPDLPGNASLQKQEEARRGRLLSTVMFFLMITLIILIPATLFIANHLVLVAILVVLAICCIALICNRMEKVLLAGIVIVIAFEVALMIIILTTRPFDIFNLPLFDFFIMAELLAVSLLPGSSVFIILFINTAFIVLSLRYQLHTVAFTHILETQFYNSLARPVALQLIVAVVAYLWVRSTTVAIQRADRAEVVANLEFSILEQKQEVEREKQLLEKGIAEIVAMHMNAARGDLAPTAQFPDMRVLWPLVTAFNTLIARLKRSYHAEIELDHLKQAISVIAGRVEQALQRNLPPPFPRTGTALDSLLLVLSRKPTLPPRFDSRIMPITQERKQNMSKKDL